MSLPFDYCPNTNKFSLHPVNLTTQVLQLVYLLLQSFYLSIMAVLWLVLCSEVNVKTLFVLYAPHNRSHLCSAASILHFAFLHLLNTMPQMQHFVTNTDNKKTYYVLHNSCTSLLSKHHHLTSATNITHHTGKY